MQGVTSRWLLRMLPWVQVPGGSYRVNRRASHTLGDGRVEFISTGSAVRVIPVELRELPLLRGFEDTAVLEALADRFTQREFAPGDVLVEAGRPADELLLIAHGKVDKLAEGAFDHPSVVGSAAGGDHLGEPELTAAEAGTWGITVKAVTYLYNEPMNQVEQQLRLTIEALRERQEHELINNPEIGLLHNADLSQRIHTRSGPPTPDDLDALLATVWKEPGLILAHPRAIAAIGREFNSRGISPQPAEVNGHALPAWRGVPILPCNKIPVTRSGVTSLLVLRTGEENQGVIGLHRTGIPDEYQPSLSVRFMGISEQAIISYLVSAYYSAAVLVPDALGILENVEIGL
ncbi:cyclic nucleotide-binding domain-containing protein [Streptomyces hygroscopicus]|uniref:cyclic nucleotide-binding domain-containing protein n=1 Tax=Streptomyces hygroscopicus TaxID=1912 RepID=UPI00055E25E5